MRIWRKRLTDLISDDAVYKTAPATPGLLKMPHTANNRPSRTCMSYGQKWSIGSKTVKNWQKWTTRVQIVKNGLNPQIPQSPNPSIPQSPNPLIPQSPNPPIPQSPNLPVPLSLNPLIPQYIETKNIYGDTQKNRQPDRHINNINLPGLRARPIKKGI